MDFSRIFKVVLPIFALFFVSAVLPVPENDILYTEFTCTTISPYIKKEIVSTGIIVAAGKDRFLYRQTSPVFVEIRKTGETITFTRGDNPSITVQPSMIQDELMVLLLSPEKAGELYIIESVQADDHVEHRIVPRQQNRVDHIILKSRGDKVFYLAITFTNKTTLIYRFFSTQTGTFDSEAYF